MSVSLVRLSTATARVAVSSLNPRNRFYTKSAPKQSRRTGPDNFELGLRFKAIFPLQLLGTRVDLINRQFQLVASSKKFKQFGRIILCKR